MSSEHDSGYSANIFLYHAPEDEEFEQSLRNHFAIMQRNGRIRIWGLRDISPGSNRSDEIDIHFNKAHIILLLISSHFMASEDCHMLTMRAMERSNKGEARVIPILLKPVHLVDAPFSQLEMLPEGNRPITAWPDSENAYTYITSRIRDIAQHILKLNVALETPYTTQ